MQYWESACMQVTNALLADAVERCALCAGQKVQNRVKYGGEHRSKHLLTGG